MTGGSSRLVVFAITSLLLAAAAVLGGWVVFDYGRHQGETACAAVMLEQGVLENELGRLRERLDERVRRVAELENAAIIDRKAREEIRADLMRLQRDNLELREELAFYRSIVSPTEGDAGIRIQELTVAPTVEPGGYRYSLTLIQVHGRNARHRSLRFSLDMRVEGVQEGLMTTLPLSQVGVGKRPKRQEIKYFRRINGSLRLPEGFEPRAVWVQVKTRGKRGRTVEKRFDWPLSAALNGGVEDVGQGKTEGEGI
ncbi:MAG TPA: hypothetical protein ENK54_03660 [Thiotrichales bacterium]|nr:hypothetical protein [Thiotrichales bacterium]